MAEENVKVAVRVRPFNKREIDANSKLIVAMSGQQTIITNPKTEEEKKFAFDYSYWSHDGFKTESNGYMSPTSSKYADQKKVYADLGEGVMSNAWQGFNASLFAYGQTGSGKSYSVVGYQSNKGIVPLVCEEIFKKSEPLKASGKQIEVTFSMLEIYSEVVRDLLNDKADKKKGLLIREDPKNGFYSQGQQKILVDSYDDITKLMDQGTANRTIASTNMNATSSRAHTIVAISLVQKYKNDAGKEMAKSSIINLVDLAGSERADATGATGDRLKEGAAINLSLTSLGNVISALADNSQGKKVKVPYRDSSLTKLLMNALGGNSKTIMIAAISPADINFDESVSTLRYADRAKQIKTKAIVNEDPTEKLINELKAENDRLKKLIAEGKIDPSLSGSSGKVDDAEMKKILEENDRAMKAMEQTYEEKLAAAKAELEKNNAGVLDRTKVMEKAKTTPHLSNINMDPALSGMIKILLEGEGSKKLGVAGKSDIPLSGLGILDPHATITNKGGVFTLEPMRGAKILRNGKAVTSPIELKHYDRLVFGTSQYFMFNYPAKAPAGRDHFFTYEMMQDEIAKESGIMSSDNKNMTQEEILCQAELVDLLPNIEEANQISIALDKKVKFKALPVSAQARGEYDSRPKVFVVVKNFATGLEWIWGKNKFLDRKLDIMEYYTDMKDNGLINQEKFKTYDPFFESPDTETQLGTATVFPKAFAYMLANKGEYKILDLKSREAGILCVEILPCNSQGVPIEEKDGVIIRNPEVELLNKTVNFIIKITSIKNLNPIYEDIYCEFKIANDSTLYRTDVLRGDNTNFKFSKQFTFTANAQFLDFILNKCLFIKIWAEQKHPKMDPNAMKISTQEYFEREKAMQQNDLVGKQFTNAVDPEKQKLIDDLRISQINHAKNAAVLNNISRLIRTPSKAPLSADVIQSIMLANSDAEADQIIKAFAKESGGTPRPNSGKHIKIAKSVACTIQ